MNKSKRHLLLILDGWGIAEDPSVSAVDAADTPFVDGAYGRVLRDAPAVEDEEKVTF